MVSVELYQEFRYCLLHLDVVSHDTVDRLRDVVHDYVQVHLVRLVSSRVESMFHGHDVRVEELLHDLKLSVLVSLILVDLLYGHTFSCFCNSCLINDSEGSISDYSLSIVSKRGLWSVNLTFFLSVFFYFVSSYTKC